MSDGREMCGRKASTRRRSGSQLGQQTRLLMLKVVPVSAAIRQQSPHLRLAYAFGLPSGPSTGAVRRGCRPCSSRTSSSSSE